MSYRSHSVAPTRVFDHLYDPLFTTSDPKNLYKENCIALTRSAPIRVYPVYNSMFSELSYEERNCYAYQKNSLPLHLPYNQIQNKKSFSITGAERPKFFCNPISNTRTINVGLMADKSIENRENDEHKRFRNTSIQTLYRESSAQTKPWLPECFTKEITVDIPEIVYVADIIESVSYPGIKEVEVIERARKRRVWEMTLPPIKTADEIPTRVAALEAFEWEEWIAREKDINECQQVRLQIVADLIEKREQKCKTDTDLKIENCKKRVLNERSHQKNLLINNFQRCMRKIDLAQRKGAMNNLKEDPVILHYDKKSDYKIPKIQINTRKCKKRVQIEYSNEFKNRFTSLEQNDFEDVQNYLKPSRQELWIPKKPTKEIERGIWNENYLKRLHETLKHFRRKDKFKRKFMEKGSSIRNDNVLLSLSIQAPDDHVDKNYQYDMLVQKTIKGRAIQSMLQKGMKKVQDIIQETKETHSIAAVRNIFPKEFSQEVDCQKEIMTEYKQLEEILKNDSILKKELEKIESKDMRNLLNYFGKELNRLQSEKQAHALYLLAERERYRREAEKLGEMSCEKQFKNDSVTLYLENILLEGINRAFDENSRSIIREMAQKIDNRASRKVTFNKNVENNSSKSFEENEHQREFDVKSNTSHRETITKLLKDNMKTQIMSEVRNNKLISQQKEYLASARQFLYKEEYEDVKREEEQFLCFEIFNEILENAVAMSFQCKIKKENFSRQQSEDAELLAAQIVEEILNDIIDNKQKGVLNKSYGYSDSTRCRDINSISETESIDDDLLADIVTQDVLNDVIEYKTSSNSEISETGDF